MLVLESMREVRGGSGERSRRGFEGGTECEGDGDIPFTLPPKVGTNSSHGINHEQPRQPPSLTWQPEARASEFCSMPSSASRHTFWSFPKGVTVPIP